MVFKKVSNFYPQIKVTFLLMMIGACLTYPADDVKPPIVNVVAENVRMDPVPNQAEPEQVPISEQESSEKSEEDLTTDNTYWWRRSYYPRRRSYYYYPR